MSTGSETNEIIFALRKRILEVSSVTKEGHVPSAFSILDILWVLYDRVLRISQHDVQSPDRDILSLVRGMPLLGFLLSWRKRVFSHPRSLISFVHLKVSSVVIRDAAKFRVSRLRPALWGMACLSRWDRLLPSGYSIGISRFFA